MTSITDLTQKVDALLAANSNPYVKRFGLRELLQQPIDHKWENKYGILYRHIKESLTPEERKLYKETFLVRYYGYIHKNSCIGYSYYEDLNGKEIGVNFVTKDPQREKEGLICVSDQLYHFLSYPKEQFLTASYGCIQQTKVASVMTPANDSLPVNLKPRFASFFREDFEPCQSEQDPTITDLIQKTKGLSVSKPTTYDERVAQLSGSQPAVWNPSHETMYKYHKERLSPKQRKLYKETHLQPYTGFICRQCGLGLCKATTVCYEDLDGKCVKVDYAIKKEDQARVDTEIFELVSDQLYYPHEHS